MNNPIEIEFAANLETPPGAPKVFNFLQIRPIVHTDETSVVNLAGIERRDAIIWSESALGNGFFKGITDIVYVKPESFNPARNKEIASDIEKLNNEFVKQGAGYVLIGPGRWGSTDPWLGIPVRWPQISAARIIVSPSRWKATRSTGRAATAIPAPQRSARPGRPAPREQSARQGSRLRCSKTAPRQTAGAGEAAGAG